MERKVLFTASTYSHINNFHLPYLRRFREEGWVVHVACGGAQQTVEPADEVIHIPFEKKMTAPANFRAARQLRGRIAEEGYELIITHTSLAAFFTRLAVLGMKERPRVINMAHGYLFDDETKPLKRNILLAAERLCAPVTDLVLTMNRTDYDMARKYRLGTRVENVPGVGVDFSRLQTLDADDRRARRGEFGIGENDLMLFCAAEFSARKSQSVLIRAMTLLPDSVYLVLAGEGALHGECWELARKLGVDKQVLFPGYVRDVGRWYAMADIAVSASRSEGLPFNIMESMYCGLPVVASAVKGHTDLITDGENGLLYPYGDHEACARQIQRLVNMPNLRKEMGEQAAQSVAEYGIEAVLPLVSEQYEIVSETVEVLP